MLDGLVITHLDVVTSTSDHLAEAIKANAPEGVAFRANVQTAGRGRRGRDWQSPAGNLYVSVLLRPPRPMAEWASLSLVAGLALHDAITTHRPKPDVTLKWPNDLLYRGDKAAGLLLEVENNAVMLGCGVNLDAEPERVEGWQAGSLNRGHAGDDMITADSLMKLLAQSLTNRYNDWCANGFLPQRQDWHDAAAHLGQELSLDQGGGRMLTGKFTGLNHDGSLCLRGADGIDHHITAGDVVRARLATPSVEE